MQAVAGILGTLVLCLAAASAGAAQPSQKDGPMTGSMPSGNTGANFKVSFANDGSQGNAASGIEGITTGVSADGRFVAFYSFASNLVAGDTNAHPDIFLRDRQESTTVLVSHGYDGAPANEGSTLPTISSDGNYVAYQSGASNIVPGDTNENVDVFIYNRLTGVNARLPIPMEIGSQSAWISGNGRYVAFVATGQLVPADDNGLRDIYVSDLEGGGVELISANAKGVVGNGHSWEPQLSYDGRFVAFESGANNLAPGGDNIYLDAFMRDRATNTVAKLSVDSAGVPGNERSYNVSISDDGRYATFESLASNLVPNDTNDFIDIFVRDLVEGTTTRASVSTSGAQGADHSTEPHISGDGRFVAFQSAARLVPEDSTSLTDIYLRNLESNTTELVSVGTTGASGSGYSFKPQASRDGTYVVFGSYAEDLVPGDTNDNRDVFLRDRTETCAIVFSDVEPGSTFYEYVMSLACQGIISGYADGTFRPNNPMTRAQLSKIVSNAAGYQEEQANQTFEDVPVGSTFHQFVERLASRNIIGGYDCGGLGEPCVAPQNRPYFRPNANVTRGQTSKIAAIAANLPAPPSGQQTFEDVPTNSTFWTWIEALAGTGAISGYPCGGLGEPCVAPQNRPYFRPNANVTRGQSAKVIVNTFFPDRQLSARD